MIKKCNIIFIFCLFFSGYLFAQLHKDSENPEPPVLEYITVDMADGLAVLHWSLSPSPDVKGYIIYKPISEVIGTGWTFDDSVSGINTTSLKIMHSLAYQKSETYTIAAIDSSENKSLMTPHHSTMYAFPYFDKCLESTRLVWSAYVGWDSISYYNIYSKTETSPSFSLIATVSPDSLNYIHTNLISDVQYCYYVEAVHPDGKKSLSNQTCIVTRVPAKPQFLIADYATVSGENEISLSFSVDHEAEILTYKILRKDDGASDYYLISSIPSTGQSEITHTDGNVDTKKKYSYKLVANNVCYVDIDTSNISSNIVLNAVSNSAMTQVLEWNSYQSFVGGLKTYNIYRVPEYHSPEIIASVNQVGPLTFSDNVTSFTYNSIKLKKNLTGKFCYFVEAVEDEALNPFGISGKSKSNTVCDEHEPRVFVPNCIYPNSTVEENRYFRPYTVFAAKNYVLRIYNRWGERIFETKDPYLGWDGKLKGGNFAKAGVYYYFLQFTAADIEDIEKSGEFTLIFF